MEFKLNVLERLVVLNVLPKEGSFVTLRVIRGIIEKVGYSPQEISDFEITEFEGQTQWNTNGNVPKSFELSEVEVDIIRKQLKKLDGENKLVQEMFSTFEKFCA